MPRSVFISCYGRYEDRSKRVVVSVAYCFRGHGEPGSERETSELFCRVLLSLPRSCTRTAELKSLDAQEKSTDWNEAIIAQCSCNKIRQFPAAKHEVLPTIH